MLFLGISKTIASRITMSYSGKNEIHWHRQGRQSYCMMCLKMEEPMETQSKLLPRSLGQFAYKMNVVLLMKKDKFACTVYIACKYVHQFRIFKRTFSFRIFDVNFRASSRKDVGKNIVKWSETLRPENTFQDRSF